MRSRLHPLVEALLLFLTIVICLYALTQLSLISDRVTVSSTDTLLIKSGIPPLHTDSGTGIEESRYFWGRLDPSGSAPARLPHNLAAKSGTPPRQQADDQEAGAVGEGLIARMASMSGQARYNPRISLPAAMSQVPRIARQRQLDESRVAALVNRYTEGTWFGLLGEPRVNVRDLNWALDEMDRG